MHSYDYMYASCAYVNILWSHMHVSTCDTLFICTCVFMHICLHCDADDNLEVYIIMVCMASSELSNIYCCFNNNENKNFLFLNLICFPFLQYCIPKRLYRTERNCHYNSCCMLQQVPVPVYIKRKDLLSPEMQPQRSSFQMLKTLI